MGTALGPRRGPRRGTKPHCWVSAPLFVLYLYKEILIIKDPLKRNRQWPKMQHNRSSVPRVTTELKSRGTPRAGDGSDVPASPPAIFSHLSPKNPHPVTPWWGLTWGHPSSAPILRCGGASALPWKGRSCCCRLGVGACPPNPLPVLLWVLKPVNRWHRVVTWLFGGAWHRDGTGRAAQPHSAERGSTGEPGHRDVPRSHRNRETQPRVPLHPRSTRHWPGLGLGHCSQEIHGAGPAHHQCQGTSPCCDSPCAVPAPRLFIVLLGCTEQQHP